MAQILFLVIDDEDLSPDILEAWEQVGVPGVTMAETLGSKHHHDATRDDLPFVVSLRAVLESQETRTRTFFSVIDDDAVVERAIAAALRVIPDLAEGHHGIMFTMPVSRVWGLVPSAPR
jgi:hypothetical protein